MAAIANVKVIESMIEIPAAQYRKVDREAEVGDIICFDDESSFVTRGGFYEVVRIDGAGDPQILDNDGDEYDLHGDEYEVYEKATECADQESAPDGLITYGGVQYRIVKRKAAVGERILIVAASDTFGKYRDGDVLTVDETDLSSNGIKVKSASAHGNAQGYIGNEEYVVLEPVKSEPPKPSTPPIRIPVGSYVKTTVRERIYDSIERGAFGKVVEDDNSHVPYKVESLDSSDYGWYKADELTLLPEAEAKEAVEAEAERAKWAAIGRKVNEYKAGDVVEIVRYQGGDPEGTITEVVEVRCDTAVDVKNTSKKYGALTWGADVGAIKLITPVEQRFDRNSEGAAS